MNRQPPTKNRLFSRQDLSKLIIPLIIEQVLSVTVGMADVMMVSSAGEAAVSGVSLVDMLNVLLINIFAALATGGAVIASQYLGCGEKQNACRSSRQLLFVSLSISLVITALVLLLRKPLLRLLFGAIEDDVMDSALTYLWITSLSYPFVALYNACAALFRAMGNSKVSMLTSLCINLINIGGNAICVYTFRMGTAGVAIPSLVSRVVACIVMLVLIRNPEQVIHTLKERFHPDLSMIKKILYIGIPSALENSMFQLGRVLVVSIIAGFGTVQIAANAVANNLDAFGCIPGQALGLAMITVVGRCIGASDYEQAKFYTKKIMKFTYIVTAALNIAILATLPLTLKLYHLSGETLQLATLLIWIHDGCAIFLWPASFTLPNALRASNDVRFPMVASVFSMWFFRILFSYIFGTLLGWGALGVWAAMLLDWFFRAVCFIWRFASGKWQHAKKLVGYVTTK